MDWTTLQYFVPTGQELLIGKDWNGNNVYRKMLEGYITINANQRFTIEMSNVERVYDVKGFISDTSVFTADILLCSTYIGGSGSPTVQSGALLERNNKKLKIYGISTVALDYCYYRVLVDYVKPNA